MTKPDVEAPGFEYVAEKACYILTRAPKGGFGQYIVDNYSRNEDQVNLHGLMFHVMKRADVKTFIASNDASGYVYKYPAEV